MRKFTRNIPCPKGHYEFYHNTDICVACDAAKKKKKVKK